MRMLRFVMLAGIVPGLWAQAMVEYGLGIAAAGTVGAPGQAASRGIAGVFSNLQKTLNSTTGAAASASASGATAAPAAAPRRHAAAVRPSQSAAAAAEPAQAEPALPPQPPKPAVVYEDPGNITNGMERSELLSRFGEPAMRITTSGSRESMTYQTKDRSIEVEVREGKVVSVQSKARPKQSAVVILR